MNNPFPEEKTEPMEGLQPRPKPVPQLPPTPQTMAPPAPSPGPMFQPSPIEPEMGTNHTREDAFTVKFAIGKLNDYLQWFVMVMEVILAFRFLLKLFGANPEICSPVLSSRSLISCSRLSITLFRPFHYIPIRLSRPRP